MVSTWKSHFGLGPNSDLDVSFYLLSVLWCEIGTFSIKHCNMPLVFDVWIAFQWFWRPVGLIPMPTLFWASSFKLNSVELWTTLKRNQRDMWHVMTCVTFLRALLSVANTPGTPSHGHASMGLGATLWRLCASSLWATRHPYSRFKYGLRGCSCSHSLLATTHLQLAQFSARGQLSSLS